MSSDPPSAPLPTSTNPPPTTSTDPTRGIPYYESLRRSLRETLSRKTLLDKSLLSLETSLYRAETLYLEDTSAGNIIRGFDSYIKGTTASSSTLSGGGGNGGGRKRGGVGDGDRVFSRSSVGFAREVSPEEGLQGEGEEEEGRRRRKGEEEGGERGERGPKRLKITYARGERGEE